MSNDKNNNTNKVGVQLMFILIAHKKKIEVLIHKLRIVKVLTLFTYTSYVTLANTLNAVIEQRTNNFLRTQLVFVHKLTQICDTIQGNYDA